jgi:serine/threonine-protein kinase ULK2
MPPTPDGIDIPTTNANTTFPPPPSAHSPTHYRTLSSSPTAAASRAATNALSRALNLASKKLFGTGASRSSPPSRDTFAFPPSPRRTQINVPREEERDPAEDLLLQGLEDLAQKTDVLTNWADELYEYVKAVPQSKHTPPYTASGRFSMCLCTKQSR